MRPGVRLGVDVGTVRIGVAVSDPLGMLASPQGFVGRRAGRPGSPDSTLDEVAAMVMAAGAVEVVVGLPRTLRGGDSASTRDARAWAASLARRLGTLPEPVPVRLVDERLSTVAAQRGLAAGGIRGAEGRRRVDAAAAAIILQAALDQERATGLPAGEEVLG